MCVFMHRRQSAARRLCRGVLKSCRVELQNASRQAFQKYIDFNWCFYAARLLSFVVVILNSQFAELC